MQLLVVLIIVCDADGLGIVLLKLKLTIITLLSLISVVVWVTTHLYVSVGQITSAQRIVPENWERKWKKKKLKKEVKIINFVELFSIYIYHFELI